MVAAEEDRAGAAVQAVVGGVAGVDGQQRRSRPGRAAMIDRDVAQVGDLKAEPRQATGEPRLAQTFRPERGAATGCAGIGRQTDQVDMTKGVVVATRSLLDIDVPHSITAGYLGSLTADQKAQ